LKFYRSELKSKLFGMDRNNRSVSLLRYLVIFTIQNLEEKLNTEQLKQIVHAGIYDYIFPRYEKRKDVKLISVYVHINYVEINFQALPVFILKRKKKNHEKKNDNFIDDLYMHSKKYILSEAPQLGKILWSENIFVSTRRQFVNQQIKAYLDMQKTLSTIEKS